MIKEGKKRKKARQTVRLLGVSQYGILDIIHALINVHTLRHTLIQTVKSWRKRRRRKGSRCTVCVNYTQKEKERKKITITAKKQESGESPWASIYNDTARNATYIHNTTDEEQGKI